MCPIPSGEPVRRTGARTTWAGGHCRQQRGRCPAQQLRRSSPTTSGGGYSRSTSIRSPKPAIIGLTGSLAIELGPDDVTVNAIAPGLVPTAGAREAEPPEMFEAMIEQQSIKRQERPEDIAAAVRAHPTGSVQGADQMQPEAPKVAGVGGAVAVLSPAGQFRAPGGLFGPAALDRGRVPRVRRCRVHHRPDALGRQRPCPTLTLTSQVVRLEPSLFGFNPLGSRTRRRRCQHPNERKSNRASKLRIND